MVSEDWVMLRNKQALQLKLISLASNKKKERDEVKSPAFSQNQIRNPTFPAKLTKKIYQAPEHPESRGKIRDQEK